MSICAITLREKLLAERASKSIRAREAGKTRFNETSLSLTIVHWRAMFVTELRRIHSAQATFVAFL